MSIRSLIVTMACLAFVAGLSALADDRGTAAAADKGDKADRADKGHSFTGRIARVDSEKRTVELRDAHPGTSFGGGKGTDGKGTATADKGDKGDKAAAGRSMTFHLGTTAKITLDGKTATLKDLKEGAYARVHTTGAGKSTGTGGARAADKGTDTAKAGRTMEADRIEVFTKAPTTGRGTGR